MTVQIGNLTFDRVRYDAEGDVLYLHRGDPSDAVDFDASPEGHALRFDRQGVTSSASRSSTSAAAKSSRPATCPAPRASRGAIWSRASTARRPTARPS